MKLYTFETASGPHLGAGSAEGLIDLTAAGVATDMMALIRGGGAALAEAAKAMARDKAAMAVADARLLPPLRPGKVLCSGINYKSHAEENPSAKMPEEPFFFAKLPTAISGPEAPIVCPPQSLQVDYEVEFAAVIGRRLARASEAEIMPALFGYTLLNDVSARDVQFKDNQITLGKNFDGFAPIGPCIVTKDALPRPDQVALRTRLNGKLMQNGTTADWLFPLPRLIAFLSQVMTLEPGDIVTTGTPAGVGLFQKPQVFMKPGDVVEIEAEGIGILRNHIVGG
jgi:2-keto-4-pentenoate hydratase/2-oxohepta-3-ene-1,7-dioic acid hydratase in catechol pathway